MQRWNVSGGQQHKRDTFRRKAVLTLCGITAVLGSLAASALPASAVGQVRKQADFNGDGFADLAVGAPYNEVYHITPYNFYEVTDAGCVNVTYGGPGGLVNRPNDLLNRAKGNFTYNNAPSTLAMFGRALSWGDFNKDGYDDLAVAVPGDYNNQGAVDIYFGSASGLSYQASQILRLHQMPGAPPIVNGNFYQFGYAMAAGDINKDGYADLAISQRYNGGRVYVVFGSLTGLRTASTQTLSYFSLGPDSLAMGDFNGDGHFDLAMGLSYQTVSGQHSTGAVLVAHGSLYGIDSGSTQLWSQDSPGIQGACEPYDNFGASLLAADFNDDGKWDLAIGAPGENSNSGMVHVLFGQPQSGLTSWANQLWSQDSPYIGDAPEPNDRFGASLAAAILNQDRFPELIVGIPGENGYAGAIQVITVVVSTAGQAEQFWNQDGYMIQDVAEQGDGFGSSLSVGDFDGNGRQDLAIGVPGENYGAGGVNVLFGVGSGLSWPNNQLLMQGSQKVLDSANNWDNYGWL